METHPCIRIKNKKKAILVPVYVRVLVYVCDKVLFSQVISYCCAWQVTKGVYFRGVGHLDVILQAVIASSFASQKLLFWILWGSIFVFSCTYQ